MKNKVNIEHILVHCLFQATGSFIYGFGIFMLLQKGFSSSIAGVIMACATGLSVVVSPFISNFADTNKRFNKFEVGFLFTLLSTALCCFNFIFKNADIFSALSYIIFLGIYASLEPIYNVYAHAFSENGIDIKYGTARAAGSFSYALMCYIYGVISEITPYTIIIICGIATMISLSIDVYFLNKNYNSINKIEKKVEHQEVISYRDFIVNHKMFVLICLTIAGMFFAFCIIDNFLLLILNNVGGSSKDVGINYFIKATCEVPFILLFDKIEKRFSLTSILRFSAFFFPVKILFVYIAKTPFLIYFSQIFQGFSFALLLPSMVSLINQTMNKKEAVRGQALYTIATTLGSTTASLISGFMADYFGISQLLLVALVTSILFSLLLGILVGIKEK